MFSSESNPTNLTIVSTRSPSFLTKCGVSFEDFCNNNKLREKLSDKIVELGILNTYLGDLDYNILTNKEQFWNMRIIIVLLKLKDSIINSKAGTLILYQKIEYLIEKKIIIDYKFDKITKFSSASSSMRFANRFQKFISEVHYFCNDNKFYNLQSESVKFRNKEIRKTSPSSIFTSGTKLNITEIDNKFSLQYLGILMLLCDDLFIIYNEEYNDFIVTDIVSFGYAYIRLGFDSNIIIPISINSSNKTESLEIRKNIEKEIIPNADIIKNYGQIAFEEVSDQVQQFLIDSNIKRIEIAKKDDNYIIKQSFRDLGSGIMDEIKSKFANQFGSKETKKQQGRTVLQEITITTKIPKTSTE